MNNSTNKGKMKELTSKEREALREMLAEMRNKKDATCPSCGHCPTCNRRNAAPYYPTYPPYPYPYWSIQLPYTTSGTGWEFVNGGVSAGTFDTTLNNLPAHSATYTVAL